MSSNFNTRCSANNLEDFYKQRSENDDQSFLDMTFPSMYDLLEPLSERKQKLKKALGLCHDIEEDCNQVTDALYKQLSTMNHMWYWSLKVQYYAKIFLLMLKKLRWKIDNCAST